RGRDGSHGGRPRAGGLRAAVVARGRRRHALVAVRDRVAAEGCGGRGLAMSPVRALDRLRDPLALGVALAMGLSLWLVAGLLGPGVPPGADALAHVLRVRFTVEELLPAARLDGWDPQLRLGYRAFLFYGPGYYWAAAALQVLSFGALDAMGAVKALAVLSLVALPAAVAFLARSFGLDRLASGLAALLALCVAACCGGVGLPGAFDVGL